MNADTKRNGIEVLSEATLKEHGDQISGGWGLIEVGGGMVGLVGALFTAFLIYQRASNSGAAFARIGRDVFDNLTRPAAQTILLWLRNKYGFGSNNYNYYNIAYNRVASHGDGIQAAFQAAEDAGLQLV